MDNLGETITWIFVTVNSARILAYLPQIRAAWRCTDGARSISMVTWGYFALAHLTGAFYSLSVANDPKLAAVFVGNCLACSALVAVVGWKRRSDALRQSSHVFTARTERPSEFPSERPLAAISIH